MTLYFLFKYTLLKRWKSFWVLRAIVNGKVQRWTSFAPEADLVWIISVVHFAEH